MSLTISKKVGLGAFLGKKDHFYATGKRKSSIARVWVSPGSGKFLVNGKRLPEYFTTDMRKEFVLSPLSLINSIDQYDVWCTLKGGGLSGQAGALRHGLSVALSRHDVGLRVPLKKEGMLTRDSRRVERKKPGRRKARRSFQFSKR